VRQPLYLHEQQELRHRAAVAYLIVKRQAGSVAHDSHPGKRDMRSLARPHRLSPTQLPAQEWCVVKLQPAHHIDSVVSDTCVEKTQRGNSCIVMGEHILSKQRRSLSTGAGSWGLQDASHSVSEAYLYEQALYEFYTSLMECSVA
jgi:allantoicase